MVNHKGVFDVARKGINEKLSYTIDNSIIRNKFKIRINLPQSENISTGEKFDLVVKSNSHSLDPRFMDKTSYHNLKEKTKDYVVAVLKTGVISPSPTVESASNLVATVNPLSSAIATIFGSTLMMFSHDPDGEFLKFTQYLRFLKRVKLIGEFFGVSLETLIESLSPDEKKAKYDESRKDVKRLMEVSLEHDQKYQVEEESNSFHNKLDVFMISVFFEGPFMVKSILYDLSWTMKVIGMILLAGMESKEEVVKWKLIFLKYQRKVHFILLMSGTMDIYFFGTRILLHRRNSFIGIIIKILCLINMSLITLDLLEVVYVSINLKY